MEDLDTSVSDAFPAVYVWRHAYTVEMKKRIAEYNIHQIITSHRVTLPPMMNLGFKPGHRVKEKLAGRNLQR